MSRDLLFAELTILIFMFVVLFTEMSCNRETVILGHETIDFPGMVIDSLTGAPLDSVTITTWDTSGSRVPWFTDSLGLFSVFEYKGVDSIVIFFREDNYVPTSAVAFPGDTLLVKLLKR